MSLETAPLPLTARPRLLSNSLLQNKLPLNPHQPPTPHQLPWRSSLGHLPRRILVLLLPRHSPLHLLPGVAIVSELGHDILRLMKPSTIPMLRLLLLLREAPLLLLLIPWLHTFHMIMLIPIIPHFLLQ
ncbi:unnamed protein product [Linum trigynum]|uniref:Uncharacterized protein n=1 Tax=Linum trigynum TaxID=586398 RepID=A0AAV2G7C2_9ROSI